MAGSSFVSRYSLPWHPLTGRARPWLDCGVLVDLFDRGMREPVPIYCDTSAAWAEARRQGGDPREASTAAWKSSYEFAREDAEPEHVMVLGGELAFDELLGDQPGPDERGPGWEESEVTRFGCLARRLWDGILDREQMQER